MNRKIIYKEHMKENNYYCRKCKKEKCIEDFYKYNLTMCKECKKNTSKIYREKNKYQNKYTNDIKNEIELLGSKINYIEILLKDVYDNILCLKNTNILNNNEDIKTKTDNNFDKINNTFDKIVYRNNNINNIIDKLEKCKYKPIINTKYEEEMKQILEDD